MAKAKKKTVRETRQKHGFFAGFNFESLVPQKFQTGSVLLIILLLLLIYLAPLYFGGKSFEAGDVYSQYSYKDFAANNEQTIWDPYIFCGIPTFGGSGWNDILGKVIGEIRTLVENIFNSMYAGYTIFLLVLAYGVYALMRYLKASKLVSGFSAIATMFSLAIITLLFIGHLNKLTTLVIFPIIFLMLLKFQEKIKLIDVLILVLSLKFMFSQWHIQIIFYIFLTVGIYYLYYYIRGIIKERGTLKQLTKSAAIFAVASILGFAMQFTTLGQMYEYTQYSTRGAASITDQVKSGGDEKSNAEYYKYHTDWSFSPGEVLTFVVPSYYGFGTSEYDGKMTQHKGEKINTYFGQMPFTDAAVYMGIIILALALFAVFTRWKEPVVQVMAIISAVFLVISFGRNFPVLFDLFFYNFPYFDKFRAPVMILNIVQIFVPVLAGLGLMKIFSLREEKNANIEKYIQYAVYVFGGIFILSIILNSAFSDWFISRVAATERGKQFSGVYDYMSGMFMSDIYVSFGLLTLTFGLALAFIKDKLSFDMLTIIVAVLMVFDIWRIDMRALHFSEKMDIEALYQAPDYVQYIKQQDNKQPFRLLNIKQDNTLGSIGQNVNYHVAFSLEDMYGYSGIKPRSFQDYMDIATPINYTLWRMLNVKYIIYSQPISFQGLKPVYATQNSAVHLNTDALDRVYFVDSVAVMKPMQILTAVKNNAFDPKHVAFLENGEKLSVDKPDSSASVKITEYKTTYIKMSTNASGNNFLFIGDTFYPKGWSAFIDGKETPLYNANHGFTGLVVPKGSHIVEMVYAPKSYTIGRTLTLILNIGLIGAFAFYFVTFYLSKKKKTAEQ